MVVGTERRIFRLVDPSSFAEIDFEAEAAKALCIFYPDYLCGVFRGSFRLESDRRGADLALIHKSLSHWFVIEVEIVSHSLEGHVLPQVRCFRYGDAEPECITSLCRAFPELDRDEAERILRFVPRSVAVVANRYDPSWQVALRGLGVQLIAISVFQDAQGECAHAIEGRLVVHRQSLGFATYSAPDKSLRVARAAGIALGKVSIEDPFGGVSLWTVRETEQSLWISKDRGDPALPHNEYVQLIRTGEGHLLLCLSREAAVRRRVRGRDGSGA